MIIWKLDKHKELNPEFYILIFPLYHASMRWLLYISIALHFVSLWEDFCRCLEYANEHFDYMYVGKEHTLFESVFFERYLYMKGTCISSTLSTLWKEFNLKT